MWFEEATVDVSTLESGARRSRGGSIAIQRTLTPSDRGKQRENLSYNHATTNHLQYLILQSELVYMMLEL